jgi:urease accessory protein
MIIQEKIGNIASFTGNGQTLDTLPVEWYETSKRILRKPTRAGREVALRFLKESPALTEGDVLYADDQTIIVVEILPCDAMVIPMGTLRSVAAACYEIGNRHLPLFIGENELLAPFEEPLFRWLTANNYAPAREERKLVHPLRSTVSAHAHSSSSLFSKILNLTNPNP